MARIYVSSTFSDLEEFRREVSLALRRLGHEDVAMEYYVAEDKRALERCLSDVASCDVYVGIFAWRYGFVPQENNPEQRSITELEYRKAQEENKPCLIFLLSEEAPWPRTKQDKGAAADQIESLRQELGKRHLVSFFQNADELTLKVNEAVIQWGKQSGLAVKPHLTDWDAYRQAVFDKHRWVRTQTIAGGTEAGIARIPLIEVFTPQRVMEGTPGYAVPDEIRKRQQIPSVERPQLTPEEEASQEVGREDQPQVTAISDLSVGTSTEPILDVLGRERTQVFLGGPGLGKSTILHYALLILCNDRMVRDTLPLHLQTAPIPFLIELRKYVIEKAPDFITYIVQASKGFYAAPVEAGDIESLMEQEGQALFLFDGVDEVFDPDDQNRVLEQIETYARQHPKSQIVVTSRIAGYQSTTLDLARFTHYRLQDFDIQQIARFLTSWYEYYSLEGTERTAPGLTQRIMDSPRLLELAGNPLLLTMMAVIYKKRDLPTERWKLYDLCAEVLLEDWDLKFHHIGPDEYKLREPLRTPQKAEILQRVSMYMLDHGRSGRELNAISEKPLLDILTAYLAREFNLAPGSAKNFALQALEHLQTRTYVLAEIDERIYGFVHRTFMEFFAACQCRDQFIARKSDYKWLTQEIFGEHWQEAEWREVLLLLIAMLHDAKAPIGEVIEHLWKNCEASNSMNVIFAARCLAEAGDLQDQAQGQDLLGKLAQAIANYVIRSSKPQTSFTGEGLQAFSMLAPRLQRKPPRTVQGAITRLNKAGSVAARMTAWQMGFALRAYEERLGFALEGLRDEEEVVRRGAIAVLEREWPGKTRVAQQVAKQLAEVVRKDRQLRVRQAALDALQRSWPSEPAILDAIESRADEETAYTYVIRLIEYLAVTWRANPKARDLILKLAGSKPKARSDYDYTSVVRAAGKALVQGWRSEALSVLLDWATNHKVARARLGALQVIAENWHDDPAILEWLRDRAVTDTDPAGGDAWWQSDGGVRGTAVAAIAKGWPGDPQTLPWLRERAVQDEASQVRQVAIQAIAEGWRGDPQTLPWLLERAAQDQAGEVRRAAIWAIGQGWGRDPQTLPWLRERAVQDEASQVRQVAIQEIAEGWRGDPQTLPWLLERAAQDQAGEVRRAAIWAIGQGWGRDPQTLSWLFERAAQDQANEVRRAAIWAIGQGWGGDPQTLPWLLERAAQDQADEICTAAIQVIARGLGGDPQTLPWLIERATRDQEAGSRRAAIEAIAHTIVLYAIYRSSDLGSRLELIDASLDAEARQAVIAGIAPAIAQVAASGPEERYRLLHAVDGLQNAEVRQAVIAGIAQIAPSDPSIRDGLLSLLSHSQHPEYYRELLDAIEAATPDTTLDMADLRDPTTVEETSPELG